RVVGAAVLLVLGREASPGGRVLRILRGLLHEPGDRAAAARRSADSLEEVLELVADAGRARADAEEDEAEGEEDREEREHPLRMPAQPVEEELVLPLRVAGRLLRLRGSGGRRRCYASIRRRAAHAVLRTSSHAVSPWR